MSTDHQIAVQLIIAYTLVGAFVFTMVITCGSLVGWITFSDVTQQQKLFVVLIVELVVIGPGSFSDSLRHNAGQAVN